MTTLTDRILCLTIPVLLATTVWLKLYHDDIFLTSFAQEDGPVENTTALLLLTISLIYAGRAHRRWNQNPKATYWSLILAIVFFWAFGEELSWGQRIFGWETQGFFASYNKQNETNLHNLVIGNQHLARVLFGNVLSALLLIYFVVLPQIYRRVPRVRKWINIRTVPVPALRHTCLILLTSLTMIMLPDQSRIWEVYELAFAMVFLSLTLSPLNTENPGTL